MSSHKLIRLLVVSLLALNFWVQAKAGQYNFINLNTQNSNLSFNKAHCITQDSQGFIWVGTADGLNRYNGRSFRVFTKEELGLSSAFITVLAADNKGNVFVGTDSGISRYDYLQDSFTPITQASEQGTYINNKVSKLHIDKDGIVWFCVLHQGLFRYDGNKLQNYFYEDNSLPNGIRAFCIDANGLLYFSTYFDDLYCCDNTYQAHKVLNNDYFKGDDIVEICRNPITGNLIIASNNHGLSSVDPKTRSVKQLMPNSENAIIESMYLDSDYNVWLSTTMGVYRYELTTGDYTILNSDSHNPYSLSDNHIFGTFVDKNGNIWMASYSKGVDYSCSAKNLFERVYQTVDNFSLNSSLPRSMSVDEQGTIWVTSENSGLFTYKDGKLKRFNKANLPNSLFGLNIDNKGKLWIGSFEGMYSLEPQSFKTKLYDKSASFMDSKIYIICITSDEEIYFGTTLGLFKYEKDNFVLVKEFDGIFVVDIIEDHKGRLWIASYADGIFCVDKGQITQYSKTEQGLKHISSNKFNSIYEDALGRIWAASFGAGFMCLDENRSPSFKEYNQKNTEGLPSNVIYKILDDSEGNLWLSSNQGLIAFNPDKDGIIRNFTQADGLLDTEFNFHSAIKLPDGRLGFGSINGLVFFSPSTILNSSTQTAEVVFSDLRVNGQIISPQSKTYLTKNINETSRIVIKARDKSFGITLSEPTAEEIGSSIPCMLEGYDKTWRKSSVSYHYTWQGVPAGKYRLLTLKKSLEVIVQEVFWKSWIAISLYILIGFAIIAYIIRYNYKKAKKQAEKEKEEYEKEREEQQYKDKMSFFMNVIHEIKTPLTLIRTPLQNLISKQAFSEEAKEDVEVISHNSDYLNQLVKELLDFISLENHGYVLEYKSIELVAKISFLCSNFNETAKEKGIKISFKAPSDNLFINADDSGLTKILNNLIHNAVKYAQSYINIELFTQGENAIVRISNDGPAIPEKLRNEIFKPFTKYSESEDTYSQSFGIGLPFARNLTELHGGQLTLEPKTDCTCFQLSLPLKSQNFQEEELNEEDNQKPSILIVEDNSELLVYLKNKLSDDYRVFTATTAEKARNILEDNNINLAISDISLPNMSGVDLCKEIKSNFEYSHIPVIILSAITNPQTKVLCMESGASQYIEKPFNLDFLKACVNSELNRSRISIKTSNDTEIYIQGSDNEFIMRLDRIIKENMSDPLLSNDQLANELSLSKTTLIRKVKALLGMTPNEYVRFIRLQTAANMLAKNNCRVNEICYAVGFNTPSYFAKCFKKQFGVLPAEYMNQTTNQ